MVNASAPQELIRRYTEADAPDPALALEIQRSIGTMTRSKKLKLARRLDNQGAPEVEAPEVEVFQDGKEVAEAPKIAEVPVAPFEVVPPVPIETAEPAIPDEVVEADQEIVKEVEAVVPAAAEEDRAETAAETGETPVENRDAVSAAMPVSSAQARERLLTGDPNAVSTEDANAADEAFGQQAA